MNDACFVVRDYNGRALAYVYFENEPGRRAAAKLLTCDEAGRRQHRQAAGAAKEHRPLTLAGVVPVCLPAAPIAQPI